MRNAKSVLLLRPHELRDVITVGEAIDLVAQGYREASQFPLINAPRRRVHSRKNVRVSNFPGGVDGLGVIGAMTRAESLSHDAGHQTYPYREHPVYLLWDSETSQLEAILIGEITDKRIGFSSLMALRTAATSGVGFRHLARKSARVAGVYGTGGQALHKVLALANERRIERYQVYSRKAENRAAYCEKMAALVEAEFVPVDDPRDVPRGADVVVCATNSNVPVFDGDWLEPGQHVVTVVGSNSALLKGGWLSAGRRENDDRTVERAAFIITNWRESVEQEEQAGLMEPLKKGIIGWDKIHELGELESGAFAGRTGDNQITYHANNNGTAAADLAIAKWVFDRCKAMGRGIPIEIPLAGAPGG
jgi:ornithine cyclodeaminase/alanine dehydrogenase-like protein (mu-crystallin family)